MRQLIKKDILECTKINTKNLHVQETNNNNKRRWREFEGKEIASAKHLALLEGEYEQEKRERERENEGKNLVTSAFSVDAKFMKLPTTEYILCVLCSVTIVIFIVIISIQSLVGSGVGNYI